MFSLVAVLVGGAMVAGGVVGVVKDTGGDSGGSSAKRGLPKTSSADQCAQVARRDPRFRLPRDLTFGPYGRAIVQCHGNAVAFTIQITGDALKPQTFYQVVLERGGHTKEIGSLLTAPAGIADSPTTVTAGPDVPLRRYDFLTVREDKFFARGEPVGEPIRAPL